MKKFITVFLAFVMMMAVTGCGSKGNSNITVCSREDGSGTRSAFVELFGIEEKDADGNKVDNTKKDAEITNSTAVMMQTIAGNKNAIGYVSMGSLDDSLKVLTIDGVAATVENVKNGSYAPQRPFNIATTSEVSEVAQDFINFIMSDEGQAVVEENGYISTEATGTFETTGAAGKIVVGGSTSVAPVMEKLKEAYEEINGNAEIEISETDSTSGMTSTIDGVCDIGMASRALKDSELESGLVSTTIAMDGIAVVVNKECEVDNLTSEQVKQIYVGEITFWDDVK